MQTRTPARSLALVQENWFVAVVLVLFFAFSIQYTLKALENRSAILRWRDQLQHLADENIYERYAYPNPPIMAMLLEPIASLPPLVGSLIWFYAKAALALLAMYGVFRFVATTKCPFPPWGKALTILLSLRPILGDLTHGNVNLLILCLVVAALVALKYRYDFTAGVVLALAIACKVTPALFIPYLLWKRAWKSLAGCALGLASFLFLIPGWYLGSERNWTLLQSWVNQMVTPYVVKGTVTTEHPNQSLPGLLFRLTTHSPSFLDETGAPERYNTVVDLDPTTVRWIAKGAMLLFALMVVFACRTPLAQRDDWRLAAECSIVVLGMLLFSERTWKHHCVTLLLPFATICYYLATQGPGPWLRAYLWGSLLAAFLLMSATSTTLFQSLDAKMAQVYGAYVWAYLVLVAVMVVLLRTPRTKVAKVA
jgi:hypothetical protein